MSRHGQPKLIVMLNDLEVEEGAAVMFGVGHAANAPREH
jgi:hypothetical protein